MSVRDRVACKYKSKLIHGDVTSVSLGDGQDNDVWTIQFEDGHIMQCGKRRLKQMLKNTKHKQIKKQIDHILVSNRWRSSVLNSRTYWGLSVHRSVTGKRSDHCLLECTWKWRMRLVKSEPTLDYSVLI